MHADWNERQERWRRLEAWESERLRSRPRDFSRALAWMADAWDLARRYNSSWGSRENAEEHWRYLVEIRRRLARARLKP